MIKLEVPGSSRTKLTEACLKAGKREIGGVLFGEHIDQNLFRIADLSVENSGLIASFVRTVKHAIASCKVFFAATGNEYMRYNYIGEWHSHPSFALVPSQTDDASMFGLVSDPEVGANFVVLVIVKISYSNQLEMNGWSYFPDGKRAKVVIH